MKKFLKILFPVLLALPFFSQADVISRGSEVIPREGLQFYDNGSPAGRSAFLNVTGSGYTLTTVNGIETLNLTGGGGGGGSVVSVTGLNTDNTDPTNPVVKISVDGTSITGAGTPGSPLIATAPSINGTGFVKATGTTLSYDNSTYLTTAAAAAAYQALDATLTALAGLNSTAGVVVETAADTFTKRTITGTANQITVTNGSGASGDPTISLPVTITGLTSVSSTGFTGALTGNASTSTALAANGTNCTVGNYPLGVDASGNAESCTAAGTGTVTNIATTSPITGGAITATGSIACPSCVTASSPGAGLAHFAGSTQTVTSSAVSLTADVTGLLPAANGGLGVNESAATGVVQFNGGTSSVSTALANGTTGTTQSALDNSTKLATTAYTDTAVQAALNGLDWKPAVGYASTANVVCVNVSSVCTYTATGTDSLDGHTLVLNDIVLLKNQTTGADNGVWKVTTAGAIGVSGVLTRRNDYNLASEIHQGDTFYVINGTVNTNTSWAQTNVVTTLNTDSLAFSQVAGPGSYTAGTGINITGVSIANTGVLSLTGDSYLISNSASTGAVTVTQRNHTANTVAGALTATTLSDLAVPSCSTAASALQWTSASGFGCNTSITANTATSATTATNATNTAITDDTTTNSAMNLTWVTSNTGNLPQKTTSTKLTFNPSTGVLSSTSFTGAGTGLTGTASSLTAGAATTAGTLTTAITANSVLGALTNVAPTAQAVPSCSTAASALTWTSGTGFACNTSITANTSTTATTATNATNSAITNDTTTNATMFPAWVTANTGNLPLKVTSTKLTYNPSTGNLSTTTFTGAVAGNSTTATALAANGTNCSAGNYPLGVDASGNSESCTAVPGAALSTATASTSANLNFDNTIITSSCKSYKFIIADIIPATNQTILEVQLSTNNGSTFLSTGFLYNNIFGSSADALQQAAQNATGGSTALWEISVGNAANNKLNNAAGDGVGGTFELYNPSSAATGKKADWNINYINSLGNFFPVKGGGWESTTTAVNYVRFVMDTGNITSGTISVFCNQ